MDLRAVVKRLQDITFAVCAIMLYLSALMHDVVELLFWGPMLIVMFFAWRDNVQERREEERKKLFKEFLEDIMNDLEKHRGSK